MTNHDPIPIVPTSVDMRGAIDLSLLNIETGAEEDNDSALWQQVVDARAVYAGRMTPEYIAGKTRQLVTPETGGVENPNPDNSEQEAYRAYIDAWTDAAVNGQDGTPDMTNEYFLETAQKEWDELRQAVYGAEVYKSAGSTEQKRRKRNVTLGALAAGATVGVGTNFDGLSMTPDIAITAAVTAGVVAATRLHPNRLQQSHAAEFSLDVATEKSAMEKAKDDCDTLLSGIEFTPISSQEDAAHGASEWLNGNGISRKISKLLASERTSPKEAALQRIVSDIHTRLSGEALNEEALNRMRAEVALRTLFVELDDAMKADLRTDRRSEIFRRLWWGGGALAATGVLIFATSRLAGGDEPVNPSRPGVSPTDVPSETTPTKSFDDVLPGLG